MKYNFKEVFKKVVSHGAGVDDDYESEELDLSCAQNNIKLHKVRFSYVNRAALKICADDSLCSRNFGAA